MIAFASLFLGLVVGVAPVTVLVEGPVAAVRFELDGRSVGRLDKAPWTLGVDFGGELLPHELVARASDLEGKEIGVARQFVNLPRPAAEVEVLLERDAHGHPVSARFSGSSLMALNPARVTVIFDEKPLAPEAEGRVRLPAYDPETRHVLSVEFEFTSAVRSRADVVFGAGESSVARSELTAVPVRSTSTSPSASPRETFPEPSGLEGMILSGSRPLKVSAVERGPALVCVVRNPAVREALKALGTGGKTTMVAQPGTARRLPQFDRDATRNAMALEKEDLLRFVWPFPHTAGAAPGAQLYDRSGDFSGADAGVHWLLTRVEHPGPYPRDLRLADAASVAGLEAAASSGRRAVVLVLGDETQDASREAPPAVRRYLEAIRVPFFVWSLKSPAAQPLAKAWGAVEDVSSSVRLEEAVGRLKESLSAQRIVWVEGRHLPGDITLSEKAAGLALVR